MCLLGFGSYFCFDNPGALQTPIKDAMHINTYQFSNLYAWYSWPNVILPIVGGYLMDSVFGIRLGTIIFATFICIGKRETIAQNYIIFLLQKISKLFMWNWLLLNFSILHSWELSFLKVRPSRHVNRFYFLPVPLRSREWRVASFMNRQFCLILENISFWNKNIWIFIEKFFLQAK